MDILNSINSGNINTNVSKSKNNSSENSDLISQISFQELINSTPNTTNEKNDNEVVIDLTDKNFADVDINSVISDKMQEGNYSKFIFELGNNTTFNVDISGKLQTDKTDDDYTGTTFEELTDIQKQELRDILQNNTGNISSLNDFLTNLVDFGVIKRSDADIMTGTVVPMDTDNNGQAIYSLNARVTRDDWNNSVVDWFCNMESNLTVRLSILNSNENYSQASGYTENDIDCVQYVQSIIEKLLA